MVGCYFIFVILVSTVVVAVGYWINIPLLNLVLIMRNVLPSDILSGTKILLVIIYLRMSLCASTNVI
jgi:hypothetical protein